MSYFQAREALPQFDEDFNNTEDSGSNILEPLADLKEQNQSVKLEHVDVDSNTNNSLLPEDDSEELFNLAYDDLDLDDQDYKPPVQTPKPKRGRKPKNNTQQQQTKSITVKKEDPEILDESQGKDIAITRKS